MVLKRLLLLIILLYTAMLNAQDKEEVLFRIDDEKVYSHLSRIWKTEHRSKLDLKYNK